jgi:3-hydroxyisobutyrate dehydrogenase
MTQLGWIGTGVMGSAMCGHLAAAGHSLTIYSRTRGRAESLLTDNVAWAESPKAVAEASDVTFSMVGHPADVREVILGPAGVLSGARPGSTLVDMTTSEPALAVEIHEAAARIGVAALDAPVSGGDAGAREARLSIMVGGDPTAFERVRPLFAAMGKTVEYHGSPGSGQHTKMVNQILIATGMIGFCEGLLYALRAGLDMEKVLISVESGAAGSWSLTNFTPRVLRNDFAPGFRVEHFLKDMEIALGEARRMNLALPGLALAHELYLSLRAQGGAQSGTQALLLALARLSNLQWEER